MGGAAAGFAATCCPLLLLPSPGPHRPTPQRWAAVREPAFFDTPITGALGTRGDRPRGASPRCPNHQRAPRRCTPPASWHLLAWARSAACGLKRMLTQNTSRQFALCRWAGQGGLGTACVASLPPQVHSDDTLSGGAGRHPLWGRWSQKTLDARKSSWVRRLSLTSVQRLGLELQEGPGGVYKQLEPCWCLVAGPGNQCSNHAWPLAFPHRSQG